MSHYGGAIRHGSATTGSSAGSARTVRASCPSPAGSQMGTPLAELNGRHVAVSAGGDGTVRVWNLSG
jgi:WD40 repeat protein